MARRRRKSAQSKGRPSEIRNCIIVSDIHAGCQYALCPEDMEIKLDGGGFYRPSLRQKKLQEHWLHFWNEWVPDVTHGEPYVVVFNGDGLDGVHHNSNTQITHNLSDQRKIAYSILKPIVDACEGRYYHIRGTDSHVGHSAENEETLAQELGSIPNDQGQHARFELWLRVGPGLVHIMHHIGTTGSMAYETTAIMKELSESYSEAGRWNLESPNVVVRSHRHRHALVSVPKDDGNGVCFTTPGWQLKTPFVWKIPGGRISLPQLGGSLVRYDGQELYTRHMVYNVERSREERPTA